MEIYTGDRKEKKRIVFISLIVVGALCIFLLVKSSLKNGAKQQIVSSDINMELTSDLNDPNNQDEVVLFIEGNYLENIDEPYNKDNTYLYIEFLSKYPGQEEMTNILK